MRNYYKVDKDNQIKKVPQLNAFFDFCSTKMTGFDYLSQSASEDDEKTSPELKKQKTSEDKNDDKNVAEANFVETLSLFTVD